MDCPSLNVLHICTLDFKNQPIYQRPLNFDENAKKYTSFPRILLGACADRRGEMLYFIGLGLGDAEDVTVKGLKIIKRASRVYLEAYTSILTVGKEALVGDLP